MKERQNFWIRQPYYEHRLSHCLRNSFYLVWWGGWVGLINMSNLNLSYVKLILGWGFTIVLSLFTTSWKPEKMGNV